jgi:hypothetical protein
MRVCRVAFTLCLMAVLGAAHANNHEVVRWVDDRGTTHFGDAHLAPAEATEVEIASANGMETPKDVPSGSRSRGPVWTVIDQAPRQNKVGWRSKGYTPRNPSQR